MKVRQQENRKLALTYQQHKEVASKFVQAVRDKDLSRVQDILDQDIMQNNVDLAHRVLGETLLYWAFSTKSLDIIQRVVEYAAANKQFSSFLARCFPFAVRWKYQPEIIELFLKNGAKVNRYDNSGNTLLYYAITDRSMPFATLKLLLNYKADPNAIQLGESSNESRLLLFIALRELGMFDSRGISGEISDTVKKRIPEIVKMLVQYGADVNRSDLGIPLFAWAIKTRNAEIIQSFMGRLDLDMDVLSSEGYTPLYYALEQYPRMGFNVLESIINRGVDVNKPCRDKYPLELFIESFNKYSSQYANKLEEFKQAIELLVNKGAVITSQAFNSAPSVLKDKLNQLGGINYDGQSTLETKVIENAAKNVALKEFWRLLRQHKFQDALTLISSNKIDVKAYVLVIQF